MFQACFSSIPQGDHLGVEFATCAHRGLLGSYGLLPDDEELRADAAWKGHRVMQGLVIDDFYVVSVEDEKLDERPAYPREGHLSEAVQRLSRASKAYANEGIQGSADKDIINESKAKVTGGELDTSEGVRRLGSCFARQPSPEETCFVNDNIGAGSAWCHNRCSCMHVSLEDGPTA